jgi:hypothetical protein
MYMSVDTGTMSTIPAEPTRNSCISVKLIVLEPASGTTIYIEEWLYVLGNITFSDDESVIVNGNFTMQIIRKDL